MKTKAEIEDFLTSLQPNFDILNYVEISQIDQNNPFWSIYQILDENGYFHENVDFYVEPLEYVLKHIGQLLKQPNLPKKYNLKLKDVDFLTIANLLAYESNKRQFLALKDKIEKFFS